MTAIVELSTYKKKSRRQWMYLNAQELDLIRKLRNAPERVQKQMRLAASVAHSIALRPDQS